MNKIVLLKPLIEGPSHLNGTYAYYFPIKKIENYDTWKIKRLLVDDCKDYDEANMNTLEILNSSHISLFASFELYKCLNKPCPYFTDEYEHIVRITTIDKVDLQLELELSISDIDRSQPIIVPFWNLRFDLLLRSTDKYYKVKTKVNREDEIKTISYSLWKNPWYDC